MSQADRKLYCFSASPCPVVKCTRPLQCHTCVCLQASLAWFELGLEEVTSGLRAGGESTISIVCLQRVDGVGDLTRACVAADRMLRRGPDRTCCIRIVSVCALLSLCILP